MERRSILKSLAALFFPWQGENAQGQQETALQKLEKHYPGITEQLLGKPLDAE